MNLDPNPTARRDWAIVAAIVLVHLALVVPLAVSLNVWLDEAFSLGTTAGTLAQAVTRAITIELQPPFYFALLWLWRSVDSSITWARLLSPLFSVALLLVTARLSRRLVPRVSPAWLVAAVALNPYVIESALEIRVYTLTLLLNALVLWFFLDGYLGEDAPRHPWTRAALVVAATALLYTQYYSGFALAAGAVALAVCGRWRALRDYCIAMAVVGVLFLPMLLQVPMQFTAHIVAPTPLLSPVEATKYVLLYVEASALPFAAIRGATDQLPEWLTLHGHWALRCLILALVVVAVARAGTLGGFLRDLRVRWLGALVVLLAVTFIVLLQFVPTDYVLPRHMAALFLPAVLLPFLVLARPSTRWIVALWTGISVLGALPILAFRYRDPVKEGDAERVAAYLMAHEAPGEPIFVVHPWRHTVQPFNIYYRGLNTLDSLPPPTPLRGWDPSATLTADTAAVSATIAAAAPTHGAIWLISTYTPPRPSGRYYQDRLERYFNRRYRPVHMREFRTGVQVWYLRERGAAESLRTGPEAAEPKPAVDSVSLGP